MATRNGLKTDLDTVKYKKVTLYLIHFEPRFKHAGHYLGICRGQREVELRVQEHRSGRGAKLCRYAIEAGCTLILADVWLEADFGRERAMKATSLVRYCSICKRNGHDAARNRGKV